LQQQRDEMIRDTNEKIEAGHAEISNVRQKIENLTKGLLCILLGRILQYLYAKAFKICFEIMDRKTIKIRFLSNGNWPAVGDGSGNKTFCSIRFRLIIQIINGGFYIFQRYSSNILWLA
jgi:hypothetical protein